MLQSSPDDSSRADADFFSCESDEVLQAFATSSDGLSVEEAAIRLEQYGPNRPPETAQRNIVLRFLSHFHNVLIYVLIAAAIVTMVLGHFIDTIVILAVVLANAVIGFVQEGRAERAIDSIHKMLAPHASVFRDGNRVDIDGALLVPGDLVLLEAGDKVPADLRLLQAREFHVHEAILTGESVPVEKAIQPVQQGAALGDRSCMAFSGTLVTRGQAKGIVTATGGASEIGRISGMLSDVQVLTTPLVRQMGVFSRWLTFLILVLAGLLLLFGTVVQHQSFTEMFMIVVGLSVSAIPEGLPAVLTITLAVGVQAMARRNAIVRRLPAIETLGSVSVICTDKTGTLTRNEMMVASIFMAGGNYSVEGTGYQPNGTISRDGLTPTDSADMETLQELALAAASCNDADLHDCDGAWTVRGDPMEGALLALAAKIAGDDGTCKKALPRIDAIPFDARHRFMATSHRDADNGVIVFLKGAPEEVLAKCSAQRNRQGGQEALVPDVWRKKVDEIAADGQRVLAFATGTLGHGQSVLGYGDVDGNLTFLGLVGLIDPPRPEAVDAVAECQRAGIRVKMITGDHAGTASAIGRQIGLQNPDQVLTGVDLDSLVDTELASAVLETDVFARTSPEHKLRLVMALQSHGLTVAMTGDGVNDAPALKRADAGIAMGQKGSEAAKEAAEVVLADDNFASIAAAVREGRTVYDNITKVISWTLPTNGGEAMTIIVALLAGMTLPVTPIQILWINLVTAITLGIALAFEPTEKDTMLRPPRPRHVPILSGELAWHVIFVSLLFLAGVFGIFNYAIDKGYPIELARTIALNTLVVMEIFHLFFIRNIYGTSLTWKAVRGTKTVWATVLVIMIAQFAITYWAPLQKAFATRPVAVLDGLLIVGIGAVLFAILEIEKQIRLSIGRARFD